MHVDRLPFTDFPKTPIPAIAIIWGEIFIHLDAPTILVLTVKVGTIDLDKRSEI